MDWKIIDFAPAAESVPTWDREDHHAWLAGYRLGRYTIHMKLQISSRDVSAAEAKSILDEIVKALSSGTSPSGGTTAPTSP